MATGIPVARLTLSMTLASRKQEVKTLAALEVLVAENSEAVAPGFRVVAAGVNLGRATIEFVGLDAHDTPALVAVGFVADDAMLFRMVEAYTWSLEFPQAIRQLMPGGGAQAGWPPRVIFVAERLADSFQNKLKALKFAAVSCFEYRYVEQDGTTRFYLDPVESRKADRAPSTAAHPADWARVERPSLPTVSKAPAAPSSAVAQTGTAPAMDSGRVRDSESSKHREPAPAWQRLLGKLAGTFNGDLPAPGEATTRAPTPERPVEPAVPQAPPTASGTTAPSKDWRPRSLPDWMQLPPDGKLTPQWRRFLETSEVDDANIATVREYLHREFPMCTIYNFYEHHRNAQVFELRDGHGRVSQQAALSSQFLEAHGGVELRASLEKIRLAHALRQAGPAGVLVTLTGLKTGKR